MQVTDTTAEVHMGEWVVTANGNTLAASGIGSCVVVTLYDPQRKIGALAHAMLPPPLHPHGHDSRDAKYTDVALDQMIAEMLARGANKHNIEAKLVGGANMFAGFKARIGDDNASSAREKLKKEGITLAGECVGGSQGRSVEFCISTGLVTVKTRL